MPEEKRNEPNFILVPSSSPAEVVSLLLDRFPGMRDVVCPDEDSLAEPHRVYDSFASQVIKRIDDRVFTQSVGEFIDELAKSKEPLIGDVLVISLLEGIAVSPDAAKAMSNLIGEPARDLLQDVEKKMYGRG